ncbi:MAG TPA: protein translocase subunit SecF [Candidatus Nitrosocosmicus sp.]|jgi:preprotein translocase SecF subunit|nr:protein translocase subunit SecF [Candidatus Nitrosocosmicus sp.]
MIQLFHDPNYNFIGRRRWAYLLSIAFILVGLGSMAMKGGLRYGIDFSGGTLIQVRFEKPVPVERIRTALDGIKLGESVIQEFGDPREFILRLPLQNASVEEVTAQVRGALAKDATLGAPEVRRVEFVGPHVGRDLQLQAIYAVLVSMAGILLYIAFRFDVKGGVASVAAIIHDVLVCLAAMSLTDREMSLPVLAALLTIIGYSVNDTIVAYDRVRENRGKGGRRAEPFAQQINRAINETLSRTVLTALTVFFSTVVLYLFGGKVLEDLAFVLTVGVVTGTYSTIFIAGALVVEWTEWVEGKMRRPKKVIAKA